MLFSAKIVLHFFAADTDMIDFPLWTLPLTCFVFAEVVLVAFWITSSYCILTKITLIPRHAYGLGV